MEDEYRFAPKYCKVLDQAIEEGVDFLYEGIVVGFEYGSTFRVDG